jgi:phage terminase large subunit
MPEIHLEINPRPQFRPYLLRDKRWASVVAHRRAGKTVACIMDLIAKSIECDKREPRFAYIAPTYGQAKDVAWAYLKEYTQGIPGMKYSESELSCTFPHNGARIRLYGAENYDRLRGLYLDGCIIDESGDIDPRAWPEVIRPALSDRRGWATFIGTPKGRNHFYQTHQLAKQEDDWFSAELKASETGLIGGAELADAMRTMTDEQYRQEYECSFDAAIVGSYYGKDIEEAEAEGRITNVPYDRAADVFVAWDLGIGDSTALWVYQIVGREWHWLNYYENKSERLDHYVDWINRLPYTVDGLILPHDAEQRELQTGKSRTEYLEGRGFECKVLPAHAVDDGINACRVIFNRCWFDAEACQLGIERLRMYRAEFDEKRGVLKPKPAHDAASHGADSFRYGVMGGDEQSKPIVYNRRRAPNGMVA